MRIFGINKRHFIIYAVSFIVSLVLLSFIFLNNEKLWVFFVSIGASGLASSILGYFIELSNTERNNQMRTRNLTNLVQSYKNTLDRFMFYMFKIIIDVMQEKPKDKLYKVNVLDFKNNMSSIFKKYDKAQNIPLVISENNEEYEKYKWATMLADNISISLHGLSMQITNITNQDLYGLLKFYTEDEIKRLKTTATFFETYDMANLEDYAVIFSELTNKEFYSILELNSIENITYYYASKDNKSGLILNDEPFNKFNRLGGLDLSTAEELQIEK